MKKRKLLTIILAFAMLVTTLAAIPVTTQAKSLKVTCKWIAQKRTPKNRINTGSQGITQKLMTGIEPASSAWEALVKPLK